MLTKQLARTLLIVVCSVHPVMGQVVTGAPPFGSFGGGPDVINLGNLNAHITVPVFSRAGRGVPFVYNLGYDTSVWYPSNSGGTVSWTPVNNWGWSGITDPATGYLTTQSVPINCMSGKTWLGVSEYVYWTYHDSSKVSHVFTRPSVQYLSGSCNSTTSITATTTDGSGYTLSATGWTATSVVSRPGHLLNGPTGQTSGSGTYQDANGNEITVNGSNQISDTLSTTPVLTVAGTPPGDVTYTYTNPQGGTSVVTVKYTTYTVQTNFGCSGVAEFNQSAPLVTSIVMPDGTSFGFLYEETPGYSAHRTGRLAEVTLPSGGSIVYGYTGSNHGIICADGSAAGFTRTVSPGGEWTYTRTQVSGAHWQTKVTTPPDPQNAGSVGNDTVIDFQQDSASYTTGNFFEVQRQIYQGASSGGNVLLTLLTCYNANYASCITTAVATPITQLDAYRLVPNGGSSTKNALVETAFDSTYGRPTEVKEYDYGVATGGAPSSTYLLRDTVVSYAALSNNIVDHPSQVTVKNGSGSVEAQTTITYDEHTPTPTTSPQHISITGSRGNATTVSSLTGTATLTRHFSYYDTGTVSTATDVNTAVTTYVYGNSTTTCGNTFPTEIDFPLSLTQLYSWNCPGAVMASSTDVNSNTTQYKYTDANFWRLTELDKANGGVTTYAYNTTSPPWDIATSSQQTSTASVTTDTVLDGLGRVTQSQLNSDPAGTDYVDTTYDALGRLYSVSNPHRSGSSPTDGTTYYSFDALGRQVKLTLPDSNTIITAYLHTTINSYSEGTATDRFFQTDGLGRVTSVCERTTVTQQGTGGSGTPVSPCNSDYPSYSGFITSYTYDVFNNITSVNQSGQTRTFNYDDLSRLTKEINPETGEKDYVYDTGSPGDLYTRTAPLENHTGSGTTISTYTFDLLHRLTNITYSDGYTKPLIFYWDVSTWLHGQQKGRMVRQDNAGTGGCGAPCAGEYYSYDIDGNIVEKASWTPSNWNSSSKVSYYTYNLLDQPTSMTDIWGNTYTTSYETSGSLTSGRPYKLTSSISDSTHPPTLYTVNSFNPLGEQATATFGNGIARAFTYDNRGRLTGITDGPGGSPVYSLAVGYAYGNVASANDSINGNWSSFQYDDFNRLKSSTCSAHCPGGGNSEGYTYSYDQYGNRWHQTLTAGSGYTVDLGFDANNHLTPAPCNDNTNYYCYDLAGNLLYNGNGSAQFFDAEGRITSYNGSGHTASYVWDSAGQRVQRTVDGVTTDYVFDNQGHENTNATGGFAASAWSELYLGGMHVNTYTNSSTYFSHNDHLGSLRTQTDPSGSNLYNGSPRVFTNRPFGEWTDYATEGWLGFTGDLLDDPDGNTFHTPNRQYNEYEGRWLTPDPAGLAAVDPMNPQTWNRYS